MPKPNKWKTLFPRTKKVGRQTHHLVKYPCCGIEKWMSTSTLAKYNGKPICRDCSFKRRWEEHKRLLPILSAQKKDLKGNPVTHCKDCGTEFNKENVHKNTYQIGKKNFHRCEDCRAAKKRQYRNKEKDAARAKQSRETDWHKWLLRGAKRKRVKQQVSIDLDWILAQFERQDRKCYWTGVELQITNINQHPLKPSLDRLNTKGDYSPENTVIAALAVNIGRNENSAEDFAKFLQEISIAHKS